MDCLQAQELISLAIDREQVDAGALASAKEHCRTCPRCDAFVRAQLIAKHATLPTPPEGLVDRVMAQVRTEAAHAAEAAAAAAAATPEAEPQSSVEPSDLGQPAATLAPRPPHTRRVPRAVAFAGAAAAVVLVLVGTLAVMRVGLQLVGGKGASAPTGGAVRSTAVLPEADQAAPPATTLGAAAPPSAVTSGSQSIVVAGLAYRLVGPTTVDTGTAPVVGVTSTSLGGNAPPKQRTVLAGPKGTVYVADDSGALLSFALVTRKYAGLTYALTATELTGFSEWPALPASLPAPTEADGQPTFAYDGADSAGVKVYRQANSTAGQGIAVAPGTSPSDPAGGNPNWTWWTQAP